MEPSPRAVAFFDSYRAAFETLDPAAITEHFGFPFHMTSDGDPPDLTAVPDAATWLAQIGELVGFYRGIGASSARIEEISSTVLSERVEQVAIHWTLHDSAGNDLYDFHASYTLADVGGSPKVVALAHDELVSVAEFLAEKS